MWHSPFLGKVSFEGLHSPRLGLEGVCFIEKMKIITYVHTHIYMCIYIFF